MYFEKGQTPEHVSPRITQGRILPKDAPLHAPRTTIQGKTTREEFSPLVDMFGESRGSMPAPPCLFMELGFHGSLLRDNPKFIREINRPIYRPSHSTQQQHIQPVVSFHIIKYIYCMYVYSMYTSLFPLLSPLFRPAFQPPLLTFNF